MIKNRLYPLVEKYINEYLYGFTKEQLQVGVTNGIINLQRLNLRPDALNAKLDDKNLPIWIKAGLISKIQVGCSIMNFIGEKPLEVTIEGVDVMFTPSYRWVIQNVNSFLQETEERIRDAYDPSDNNSKDIFTQKVNVFDSSIFKQTFMLEIFKDKSKISEMINKIFHKCFKFYYMKNYAISLTIKDIHIRFEDDQLINFLGDIALGLRIEKFAVNLSSEGIMKRDTFKLDKLDVYWELKPRILIPSEVLTNSLEFVSKANNYAEGTLTLDEKYYQRLKAINFSKFSYAPGTSFIVENFNCSGKLGTQSMDSGDMDLFSNKEKTFKMYIQFASSELNLNIFPELAPIASNFKNFFKSFIVIKDVESFKPMRKPMDRNNPVIIKMINYLKRKGNEAKVTQEFLYKKRMYVRDWLFYFFWCKKCTTSMEGKSINPLRLEFSRFYNVIYGNIPDEHQKLTTSVDKKKDTLSVSAYDTSVAQKSKQTPDNPNPDNVNINLIVQVLIKGVNVNLHSPYANQKNTGVDDYVSIKLSGGEIKINLDKKLFDLNINFKGFNLGPKDLIEGERVVVNSSKKQLPLNQMQMLQMMGQPGVMMPYGTMKPGMTPGMMMRPGTQIPMGYQRNQMMGQMSGPLNNMSMNIKPKEEENEMTKMLKKDPSYYSKMKLLNEALLNVGGEGAGDANNKTKNIPSGNRNQNRIIPNKELPAHMKKAGKGYTIEPPCQGRPSSSSNMHQGNKGNSQVNPYIAATLTSRNNFLLNLLSTTKGNNPNQTKENEERKSKDKNLSIKLAEFNRERSANQSMISTGRKDTYSITTSSQFGGGDKKIIPLSLFEVYSNNSNPSFHLQFTKSNSQNVSDSFTLNLGTLRLNLFSEYFSYIISILGDYKAMFNKPQKKAATTNKLASGLKLQRQLMNMKKYIYNYLMKLPEDKKDWQVKEYLSFLKKELEVANNILKNRGNFEINYLLSMFANGVKVEFDYDNFECVYYKKEGKSSSSHKILGKFLVPRIGLLLKLTFSSLFVKFYDLEFEINDLENSKELVTNLLKIMEEKLKTNAIFIQPCFKELREAYDKFYENKEKELNQENAEYEEEAYQNVKQIHRDPTKNIMTSQDDQYQANEQMRQNYPLIENEE